MLVFDGADAPAGLGKSHEAAEPTFKIVKPSCSAFDSCSVPTVLPTATNFPSFLVTLVQTGTSLVSKITL